MSKDKFTIQDLQAEKHGMMMKDFISILAIGRQIDYLHQGKALVFLRY